VASVGECSRILILSKFTVVSSFEEWFVLEVGAGQLFPREDSLYPGCTMISAEGMAQLGEWSKFINQGQTFPRENSFSPGCTMISAEGMA
jgi:hypothetical protein